MVGALIGLLSWKRLCLFLMVLITVQNIFQCLQDNDSRQLGVLEFLPRYTTHTQTTHNKTHVDGLGTLTAEQCDAVFPHLYNEVDRAVANWGKRHQTIREEDTGIAWRKDGALRILIHNNKLRILETKVVNSNSGYQERALSVLSLVDKALQSASAAGEILPTIQAAIVVDDMSLLDGDPSTDTRSIWTFTSNVHDHNHERHWLIPDFSLFSARATGSFEDSRQRAQHRDSSFAAKIPKVVWRGVTWTNKPVRGALVDITRGSPWADVAIVNWTTKSNVLTMDEHCKYAFTVQTEGRSYSGRLPFLLNCDSLAFIHRPWDWRTHLHHLLVKSGRDQNFVPVKRDFSDLERHVEYYLDHPREAQRIIHNSINTFRNKYTTATASSCYLRRLIAGYSTVSFKPRVTRPTSDNIAIHRGISFEDYVLLNEDYSGDDAEPKSAQ